MGATSAAAVLGVTVLLSFVVCGRANVDVDEHDLNDKFLDTLIKTKDSRSFLNDLIYKIQLLLNDTDDPQQHTTLASPKSHVVHWAAEGMGPSAGGDTVDLSAAVSGSPSSSANSSSSNSSKSGSSNSSVPSFVRQQPPQKQSKKQPQKQYQKQSQKQSQPLVSPQQQASLLVNVSLESLLALPANMTMDSMQIFNQTGFMSNETVVDVAAEREAKRNNAMGPDASQRVATLGVIICLTFVGTATCIVVMALYSSKFSGIILLSNGRWWCPMVTRGNGVERQLLV
ncbi:uncharacterized protein LOC125759427 [Rhipicephalus sanguineus]|uniref:Uncharacterized protein n=1 Tax=Rhipicephalus sanguineus TaxID=34632 RepID=A0A9D4PCU5_RHISA|nr:uncharacterized protein LOC125759427 [Rhipicephalus sanguineus]KAH7938745.1 hypothetical protein HPB52_000164 [Rhipicephalus sanguineus]